MKIIRSLPMRETKRVRSYGGVITCYMGENSTRSRITVSQYQNPPFTDHTTPRFRHKPPARGCVAIMLYSVFILKWNSELCLLGLKLCTFRILPPTIIDMNTDI
jgi:hypothetical protein